MASPSISVSPTSNSSDITTVTCYDYPAWEDTDGDTCQAYETKKKCSKAYLYRDSNNITATDACCTCLGGYRYDSVDHSSGEVDLLVPSLSPTLECYDYPGWQDVYNYTCPFYEKQNICWWSVQGTGNATASDACCYCNGGHSMVILCLLSHR